MSILGNPIEIVIADDDDKFIQNEAETIVYPDKVQIIVVRRNSVVIASSGYWYSIPLKFPAPHFIHNYD